MQLAKASPSLVNLSMSGGPPSSEVAVPKIFTDCSNCGKEVLTSNLQLHEAHCARNRCRCQHCGEAVARSELEDHRREQTRDLPQLLDALTRGDAAQVRTMVAHGEGVLGSWRRLQLKAPSRDRPFPGLCGAGKSGAVPPLVRAGGAPAAQAAEIAHDGRRRASLGSDGSTTLRYALHYAASVPHYTASVSTQARRGRAVGATAGDRAGREHGAARPAARGRGRRLPRPSHRRSRPHSAAPGRTGRRGEP